MVATQPISIASHSRSHSYTWASQSPQAGSASSISVHPAPIFMAGSFGSVGSVGGPGTSFGSRFYPACSPAQIITPLEYVPIHPSSFLCCGFADFCSSLPSSLTTLLVPYQLIFITSLPHPTPFQSERLQVSHLILNRVRTRSASEGW